MSPVKNKSPSFGMPPVAPLSTPLLSRRKPRVAAAEDRLTALEPTAPDDAGRTRALSLRDASRQARARMAQLTGPVPNDTWALDLDAIIADLEAVLQSKMEA